MDQVPLIVINKPYFAEELTLSDHKDVKRDFEQDFDKYVPSAIDPNTPCYLLLRMDTKASLGYDWFMFSWIPETATTRQKMLYASTKATLKNDFGSAYIKEEMHATTVDEASLEGYKKHKRNVDAPAPLTSREEELQELRKMDINTEINADTRQQTLGGISCPLNDEAVRAIRGINAGQHDYLQFRIELKEEKIYLEAAETLSHVGVLSKRVPSDKARYHLYLFKHTHEGDYQEKFVFIYSMPGYNCSVKERMMYSSCKAPFVDTITALGVEIAKKIEIDNGEELTEAFLQEELHPKKILHRPQFAKPKGPPNRGAKRIMKDGAQPE